MSKSLRDRSSALLACGSVDPSAFLADRVAWSLWLLLFISISGAARVFGQPENIGHRLPARVEFVPPASPCRAASLLRPESLSQVVQSDVGKSIRCDKDSPSEWANCGSQLANWMKKIFQKKDFIVSADHRLAVRLCDRRQCFTPPLSRCSMMQTLAESRPMVRGMGERGAGVMKRPR